MTSRIDIWVESAGLGHVTRQINLVDHLSFLTGPSGISVRFIVDSNGAIQDVLKRAGHSFIVRVPGKSVAFTSLRAEWDRSAPAAFILDSVNEDQVSGAETVLRYNGVFSVVMVDDPDDRDVSCDLLVNALPGEVRTTAKTMAGTALRGVQYLILPPEYAAMRSEGFVRGAAKCEEGFAFFGGVDLEDFTSIFLDAISSGTDIRRWTLLLGPGYGHVRAAERRVEENRLPVTIVRYVESMATTLRNADIAVLAAGNTLGEAAATGTPVIALSQNPVQAANARFFSDVAGIIDLGRLADNSAHRLSTALRELTSDPGWRREMSSSLLSAVDGLGGRRVAELIARQLSVRQ